MKLYEIAPALLAIQEQSDDGELTDEMIAQIANLEMALEDKLDACCCVLRGMQAHAEAYLAEAARMRQKVQIAQNNVERLKNYMQTNLETLGIERLEMRLFKLRLQKNPPSCVVGTGVVVAKLPEEFKKVTVEPNKSAILAAYKECRALPAGITVVQTKGLRIQ